MLLYEDYHFNRRHLKRIIDDRDFTYSNIIYFLKKYLSSETKILDIGCGVGTIDFYLALRRNFVVGIDISRS
jgi:SAM-dependent methyltransferase